VVRKSGPNKKRPDPSCLREKNTRNVLLGPLWTPLARGPRGSERRVEGSRRRTSTDGRIHRTSALGTHRSHRRQAGGSPGLTSRRSTEQHDQAGVSDPSASGRARSHLQGTRENARRWAWSSLRKDRRAHWASPVRPRPKVEGEFRVESPRASRLHLSQKKLRLAPRLGLYVKPGVSPSP
jgi:hypothetical protein